MKNFFVIFCWFILHQYPILATDNIINWSRYGALLQKYAYTTGTAPNIIRHDFWNRRDMVAPNGGTCESVFGLGRAAELQACHTEGGPWIRNGCLTSMGYQVLLAKCVGKTWCNQKEVDPKSANSGTVAWCT